MSNAIIVVGTAIFIGNAHLHRRQDSEVEDVAAVDGIIEDTVDDMGDEEEGVVGTTGSPRSTNACCSDHVRIRRACT